MRRGRLLRRLDPDRQFYLNLDLDLAKVSGMYGSPGPYLFGLRRCGAMESAIYPPHRRLGVGGVFDPVQIGL